MALLVLEGVHTYYGNSHILHGVSLSLERGSIFGVIGRTGVGKTTKL